MQMRFIARPLPAALQPATVKRAGAIVARASSVFGRNGTRENTADRRPSGGQEVCADLRLWRSGMPRDAKSTGEY